MDNDKKKRGFAAISPERLREIASQGGVARKRAFDQSRRRNGQSPGPSSANVSPNASPS